MWKLRILIFFTIVKMCFILTHSHNPEDESFPIDKKNISWVVGIYKLFTEKSSKARYIFKCQGILVKPTIAYTTDQCLGSVDSHEDLKICTYDWNDMNIKNTTLSQQRDVIGIGYKRIYLSSSAALIPVRRLIIVYFSSSFDLHSDLPYYPVQQSLRSNIMSHVDMKNCHYISLVENKNNGVSMIQHSAKYVTDKEVCCSDNNIDKSLSSTHTACTRCDISRDIFCAAFSGKMANGKLQRNVIIIFLYFVIIILIIR